ncbi:MAG: ISKra4 family transposase [Chloroflexia bacterium]
MKVKVQVTIEHDGVSDNYEPLVAEVACFERAQLSPETLGLTLAEGKALLAGVQQTLVTAQTKAYVQQHGECPHCGAMYGIKGKHTLTLRTLFGKLRLFSPRYYNCSCRPCHYGQVTCQPNQPNLPQKKSFSPLAMLLSKRTLPEFQYLQTKWAALMSYGLTASMLEEVLPLDKRVSIATISAQVGRVADRVKSELGEEQAMFIEGCPAAWAALPEPDGPITVGLDGGYVHGREGKNRKAGCFEVIVGKSMPQEGPFRRFGYVNGPDRKPKRRLYELLKAQGMQENQQMIFLSDGGDTVRALPLYMNPQSEHLLDWFHVAMRLTVLSQMAKGIPKDVPKSIPKDVPKGLSRQQKRVQKGVAWTVEEIEDEAEDEDELEEEEADPTPQELIEQLERVKWYLWHGNVFRALQVTRWLEDDAELLAEKSLAGKKLAKAVREFLGYINANQAFIVNYGDRYRNGETISSAFVESTVNEVISKRFEKKQSMRWTKVGTHRLLQVRIQVLDGELRRSFERWYPGMKTAMVKQETEEERYAA